jgi:hypothetical protein
MENSRTNGWTEYKERVLYQLEELGKQQDKMNTKLDRLVNDITVLKTKAWFYGAGAGFVITIVVNMMFLIMSHGKII